jgi:predicted regulator of Ras-like GTPase activity (Roadblock/LC7/MglB family)
VSSPFLAILTALTRQRGVLGSMVVGEGDGIIVDSNLQIGLRGPAVAALAASLYRKARLASAAAGLGAVQVLRLEADRGHIFVAGREELVLVTVAAERANVGLIRVEMLKAAEALAA